MQREKPDGGGPPRILFLFSLQQHSLRQVLRGVMRHAQTHARPEVQFSGHGGLSNLDISRDRRPFAAIGNWGSLDAGSRALLGRPECRGLVQIRDGEPDGGPGSLPTATLACDNADIGRAAADLFAGRRRTNFGFVGVDWDWSVQRQESFAARLRERGFECPAHVIPRRKINWRSAKAALARWLRALPKPCAVFASFDQLARLVLEICAECGIAVPEQMLVLGVDNEEPLCELTMPTLSSIQPDFETCGYLAGELCEAMLEGRAIGRGPFRYGIRGIVERESTQDVHGAARIATAAREFVRRNAAADIAVPDIAKAAGCSVRHLDRHYRTVYGTTPVADLAAERLRRACDLLRDTNTPIGLIASLCGFGSDIRLKVAFKRAFGVSMRDWRRQNRETPGVGTSRFLHQD